MLRPAPEAASSAPQLRLPRGMVFICGFSAHSVVHSRNHPKPAINANQNPFNPSLEPQDLRNSEAALWGPPLRSTPPNPPSVPPQLLPRGFALGGTHPRPSYSPASPST